MTGMGNDGYNNNPGMRIGMGMEEMKWHLLFIVYEIMGWDWVTKQAGLDR